MVDIYITEYNNWIHDINKKRCLPILVNEALSEMPFIGKPSPINDFKSNKFQGLSLQTRGYYQRKDILSELHYGDYSLSAKLKLYIHVESDLTLERCINCQR